MAVIPQQNLGKGSGPVEIKDIFRLAPVPAVNNQRSIPQIAILRIECLGRQRKDAEGILIPGGVQHPPLAVDRIPGAQRKKDRVVVAFLIVEGTHRQAVGIEIHEGPQYGGIIFGPDVKRPDVDQIVLKPGDIGFAGAGRAGERFFFGLKAFRTQPVARRGGILADHAAGQSAHTLG
ncbi:hypothetical protein SDC9_104975 [bioreactor metagenome]|uniref:Uncharacterized protein n=1 Tax=bioreactor metagenome TaxID=1076179 RepID=A0A645AZC3_9ZZZZ